MGTLALWRFDDSIALIRPADAIGNVAELDIVGALTRPAIVDAATGRGRQFVAGALTGLVAQDLVAGSTLASRDLSIQAIISWDIAAQNTAGFAGILYARGKSGSVAERLSGAIELVVINAALGIGAIRWRWQTSAGSDSVQLGGYFAPPASGFLMLTATRRWVSSSQVILRYYLGDRLLAEIDSFDGDIPGGTTGTTQIGARSFNGTNYSWHFAGVIDELRAVDRELTIHEIAATYRRITSTQPSAYQLARELHPPGLPISSDPASRVQRETRIWGDVLGFAAAQGENVRENILPDQAYGEPLAQWEAIVKQPPRPGDSIDTRRARVVGRMRQRQGVSLTGLGAALTELVATDVANLEFLAFTPMLAERWDQAECYQLEPAAQWTAGATLRAQLAAGTKLFDGNARDWYTATTPIAAAPSYPEGTGARILAKITPTTIPANGEAGAFFGDWVRGNYLLFGIRNAAGVYQLVTERFVGWVSQGVTVRATTSLIAHWLHLAHTDPRGASGAGFSASSWNFSAAWSTTSQLAGYTTYTGIAHAPFFQWAGFYARTFAAATAAALDVTFDEGLVIAPAGDRSLRFYVYRNPALAGSPDSLGAHAVIAGMKHAHTEGTTIASKSLLCDDLTMGCDRGPMGAY